MIKMYKAVDSVDGSPSLFAVKGEVMAVSFNGKGQEDWFDPEQFDFREYYCEDLDEQRMVNPVLLWEK